MLVPHRSSLDRLAREIARDRQLVEQRAASRLYEELDTWETVGSDSTSSYGAGYAAAPGFMAPEMLLDPVGLVHVRGAVRWNVAAGSTTMVNLPEDYQPLVNQHFLVAYRKPDMTTGVDWVTLQPAVAGVQPPQITQVTLLPVGTTFFLDPITYVREPV